MILVLHLAIALVLLWALSRALGSLARKLGQPAVMGEILAGILLGPSLLGLYFPEAQAAIFPESSRPWIQLLAQVALGLYMFAQGAELDWKLVSARAATGISVAGIVAPLAIGGALGLLMSGDARYFPAGVTPAQGALFLGVALAITAFPVLARIVEDRGLKGTPIGSLALAAGAANDAVAWALFAAVQGSALRVAAFGTALIIALATLGRRALAWLADSDEAGRGSDSLRRAALLAGLFAACVAAERTGLHAVFGAFAFGAILKRGRLADWVHHKLGPLAGRWGVPVFFLYSGMNTKLALLDSWGLVGIALLVLLAASASKALACSLAARASGFSVRESAGIGFLMNARGLMELILLNIGLAAGLISPTLFSILVVMAIGTTLLATPAFELTRLGPAPEPSGARA
ncbi:MAG TPA: cation:proton antiporter [Bdellovibrionota bacterium]|nr:cation:proton antiporter [Bdellovibrionota bacterium]